MDETVRHMSTLDNGPSAGVTVEAYAALVLSVGAPAARAVLDMALCMRELDDLAHTERPVFREVG